MKKGRGLKILLTLELLAVIAVATLVVLKKLGIFSLF